MSKTLYTLETKERIPGGKLTEARKQGLLPAVYYGSKAPAQAIFLDRIEFQKVYKAAGGSSIVTLTVGPKKVQSLIQEVHVDPVTGVSTHVDFMVVDTTHTMHVSIPLEFIGEAPGAKTHNASVGKVLHEIEVEAMADKLPHNIVIDLATLIDLDSQITIADIVLPEGVSISHQHKDTDIVANLSVQKEEVEEDTAEIPAEASVEEAKAE